jgi:hypothetical protein
MDCASAARQAELDSELDMKLEVAREWAGPAANHRAALAARVAQNGNSWTIPVQHTETMNSKAANSYTLLALQSLDMPESNPTFVAITPPQPPQSKLIILPAIKIDNVETRNATLAVDIATSRDFALMSKLKDGGVQDMAGYRARAFRRDWRTKSGLDEGRSDPTCWAEESGGAPQTALCAQGVIK